MVPIEGQLSRRSLVVVVTLSCFNFRHGRVLNNFDK